MLERFKELFSTIKDTTEAWIEKAKSSGLFHKSLLGVAGFIAVSVLLIVVCKVMGVLLDSVYNFVERHFFCNSCFLFRRQLPGLSTQREESRTGTGTTGTDTSK